MHRECTCVQTLCIPIYGHVARYVHGGVCRYSYRSLYSHAYSRQNAWHMVVRGMGRLLIPVSSIGTVGLIGYRVGPIVLPVILLIPV